MDSFSYFYYKQFRKDLIDKYNVATILDLEIQNKLEITSLVDQSENFELKKMHRGVVYSYVFEAFCNQKPKVSTFLKKKKHKDDFDQFFLNLYFSTKNIQKFFHILNLLYVVLLYQRKSLNFRKPRLIIDEKQNAIIFTQLFLMQLPWVPKFEGINFSQEMPLHIKIKLRKNFDPKILLLFLQRCGFFKLMKFKLKKD